MTDQTPPAQVPEQRAVMAAREWYNAYPFGLAGSALVEGAFLAGVQWRADERAAADMKYAVAESLRLDYQEAFDRAEAAEATIAELRAAASLALRALAPKPGEALRRSMTGLAKMEAMLQQSLDERGAYNALKAALAPKPSDTSDGESARSRPGDPELLRDLRALLDALPEADSEDDWHFADSLSYTTRESGKQVSGPTYRLRKALAERRSAP